MGSKRFFDDSGELDRPLDEHQNHLNENHGSSARKRLKDADCPTSQPFDSAQQPIDEPAAQSNELNSVVQDLVTELVNTTTESEQLELSVASLDESFKLNYDFGLVVDPTDDLLINDQRGDELTAGQSTAAATTTYDSARFDSSFTEHNYANNCANVPSTSTQSSTSSNQSSPHPASSKPVKGALRFHNPMKSTNKKNVKFKGVTVFYFSRNQGGSTVPR